MKVHQLLASVTASLALAACVTTSSVDAPYLPRAAGQSFALTLAEAGGLRDIKDAAVPTDTARTGPSIGGVVGGLPGATAYGGLTAAGVLPVRPGFGVGATSLLNFASLLVLSNQRDPWAPGLPRLLAWVPKDQANDAAAARRVLQDLVDRELAAAVQAVGVGAGYTIRQGELRTLDVAHRAHRITGGECTANGRCGFGVGVTAPKPGFAPAALGGYPAWVWGVTDEKPFLLVSGARTAERFDDLAVYQAMSAKLPEWAAIYLPPTVVSYRNESGSLGPLPIPVVLHKGATHLFVREDAKS